MEKKKNIPILTKLASLPRTVRIIAALLAVSLVLGCAAFVCWRQLHFDRNGDDRCDLCGEYLCALYVREHDLRDCLCLICGAYSCTTDEAHYGWCIHCGEYLRFGLTPPGHMPLDGDRDSLCDTCGGSVTVPPVTPHCDNDLDGICEHCKVVCDINDCVFGGCACMICGRGGHLCYADEDLCMRCGFPVSLLDSLHQDGDRDGICEHCQLPMCFLGEYSHRLKDCSCQICGISIHDCFVWGVDFCSLCGDPLCLQDPALHRPGEDCICLLCGSTVHEDRDGDILCDQCIEPMCLLELDMHRLGEYCRCRVCGVIFHEDNDGDQTCDYCTVLLCADGQEEHKFEGCLCLRCGIRVHTVENCACLFCGEERHSRGIDHAFCGDCGQRLSMLDKNEDGICDICGGDHHTLSSGPDDDRPHGDADGDRLCDCCGEYICRLYGYDDIDGDDDGVCDICATFICTDHHGRVSHYDDDGDSHCDICNRAF